jgi:hypothetical protein
MIMLGDPYPKLKAPQTDGQTLLWPDAPTLLASTRENHALLRVDETVRLCGLPLPRVRTWQRRWLGHPAADQPLVGTGHQSELYHPGVWVKNIAIDVAARKLGGVAMHFSVDTDSPKHLELRWPGGGDMITDDPLRGEARWTGRLRSPTAGHVQHLSTRMDNAATGWQHQPVARQFLDCLEQLADQDVDLPAALANAHHRVDRELGLRHQSVVCSPMWRSTGYLVFAYDLLRRAGEFAAAYNRALAAFRREHGIRSPGRPMPDLSIDGEFCETPFWVDSLKDGFRKRATVVRQGNLWTLRHEDHAFEFASPADGWAAAESLQTWLSHHKLRLSPRALTLTTFLRLCVVDQFVHGIGGGLYDQVTDTIIRDWFGMQPPAFSVATATMLFPAAVGRERVCLHCLRQEGRRIRQAVLGDRKRDWVARIAALPRLSPERTQLFFEMHRELARAAETSPQLAAWQDRYRQADSEHEIEQAIFDRELPYTIQPQDRLQAMILRFESQF